MLCYCKRCLALDKFLVCVNEEYSTKSLVWLWKKQLYWSWPGQSASACHESIFLNFFGFFKQHISASIYSLISLQTNVQDMFVWICLGPISRCIQKLFSTYLALDVCWLQALFEYRHDTFGLPLCTCGWGAKNIYQRQQWCCEFSMMTKGLAQRLTSYKILKYNKMNT